MFLNIDQHNKSALAILDDSGCSLTYGALCAAVEQIGTLELPRCVVFCMCENSAGSLLGYIAFETYGQVPLTLNADMDSELLETLMQTYRPSYFWIPEKMENALAGERIFASYGYVLTKTSYEPYAVHKDLSLLMTTSGSTGSPKLVRYKYGNLEANAANVASVFQWTPQERGICDLPMHYTMGLNVINSHLIVGAAVLMIKRNLMDPLFWEFIREQGGTNFCGVPYSYEIIRRLGFDRMDLPALKTMAEGGGKMTDKMFRWIAGSCSKQGRRFFATFGTTETSARMAYLPPELAEEKIGSIGRAIPQGELFLLDEILREDGYAEGELAYRGPNVTMGYAESREELSNGDEFNGEYHTGDIAKRDPDGFYYIIGRKKRFLKLFGMRVGLDETERIIQTQFGCECVCTGDDKRMNIFITQPDLQETIRSFISEKTKLHISAFRVIALDAIPRNDYGKVRFAELNALAETL